MRRCGHPSKLAADGGGVLAMTESEKIRLQELLKDLDDDEPADDHEDTAIGQPISTKA